MRHQRHGHGHLAEVFGKGGRGFRSGRKLGAVDLQLVILALLAENPRHGYEIIKALDERSGGFYVPSPGMVYPALTYLEEIGFAVVEAEGTKKLYRITDTGRAHLETNRKHVDWMLERLEWIGKKWERFRGAFTRDEAAPGAETEEDDAGTSDELRQVRRDLKDALRESRHASPEEQKRVAEILRQAMERIRGK
jgi:DNA-binding PadR family transcriptional regulator